MKYIITKFISVLFFILLSFEITNAQTERNPVLEFCTGTWCQWCPCGDQMIEDNVIHTIPNAIILAYHGAGSDPFRIFPGSGIIGSLGLSGYPSGVIDRVSGIQPWNSGWVPSITNRNSVPATVSIEVERSYNKTTREFNATLNFTALSNLNGQFSYSVILVEDSIIYGQTSNNTCTPGITYIPDYMHLWLVREMMNGVLGEEIINGAWNQGELLSIPFTHTVTVPASPAPDIIPENCSIVVIVYKNGAPLNSNAEIQQAVKMVLINPDYLASISSTSPDVITENTTPAEFTTVLHNDGLLDDVYYVNGTVNVAGWTGEFTTSNGTFSFDQTDSIEIASGDSAVVTASINPNGINGYGVSKIEFESKNNEGFILNSLLRTVTTTGIDLLVIDATSANHSSIINESLQNVFTGTYGVVTSEALQFPNADVSGYKVIIWQAGNFVPVLTSDNVTDLQNYLDQDGRLLITGQDIGADIFEATGLSQNAQSFYNNYLHSSYVSNFGGSYFITGFAGDPITDGLAFPINVLYTRSPDELAAFDTEATPILKFGSTTKYSGFRIENENYRAVYLSVGIEQIDDAAIRDSLVSRSIAWLMENISVGVPGNENVFAESYSLNQNYPNPFNPTTMFSYSIADEANVNLTIYDVRGAKVAELINEKQSAGSYEITFDASGLSSGMYFYKLTAGDFISVKKMTLLK